MMISFQKYILSFGILFLLVSPSAFAQNAEGKVHKVLVRPMPRMVEKIDEETFVGFEIDLWKEIANRVGINFVFEEEDNFQTVLDSVENGSVDFALATTSIRSARAQKMSFSQPYLQSGISVLVHDQGIGFFTYITTLLSPLLFQTVGAYLFFCILFGITFWFIERKSHNDINHHYWPGIFDGLWHAFKKPWSVESQISRILVWPLWVITLLFSSVITAQVIENYDVQKENYLFRGVPDYSKITIGVVSDTSSDKRLTPQEDNFRKIIRSDSPEELYSLFKQKEIDAIVAELPLIIDLQNKADDQRIPVSVRPEKLSEEFYGIAINYGIDWRMIRSIDQNIMELRDNGFIKELQKQWLSETKKAGKLKVKISDK